VDADKNIELVVKTSAVEFVEDLHPDKDIEDDGVELELLALDARVVVEDGTTGEVENENDDQLEDGLANDHLPHVHGDEWRGLGLRRAVEDGIGRRIGGESESSHSVHDQVDLSELVLFADKSCSIVTYP
jgi:hypothetical protein